MPNPLYANTIGLRATKFGMVTDLQDNEWEFLSTVTPTSRVRAVFFFPTEFTVVAVGTMKSLLCLFPLALLIA